MRKSTGRRGGAKDFSTTGWAGWGKSLTGGGGDGERLEKYFTGIDGTGSAGHQKSMPRTPLIGRSPRDWYNPERIWAFGADLCPFYHVLSPMSSDTCKSKLANFKMKFCSCIRFWANRIL